MCTMKLNGRTFYDYDFEIMLIKQSFVYNVFQIEFDEASTIKVKKNAVLCSVRSKILAILPIFRPQLGNADRDNR
jgi:hypothetical protein